MKVSLSLPKAASVGRLSVPEEQEDGFGPWVAVRSSTLSHCRYNVAQLQMDVLFLDRGAPGPVYRYSNVDEATYAQLLLASSPGSYLHRHVKSVYKATRIS